jgi:hypothetical protein
VKLACLLLAIAACASRGGGPETEPVVPTTVLESGSNAPPPTDTNYRLGPANFPVPKDASTVEETPPDHTFSVLRKQAEVVAELRVNLAQMGFSIDDEYQEDRTHTHWYITKQHVTYKVSVAGDSADKTLIILTVE